MTNTYTHPTDNWRCFPDVVDITLAPQNPLGDLVPGVKAKSRPLSGRELVWAASVGLPMNALSWNLWTETLGGVKPKPLDEIVESDGTVWIVRSAVSLTLGTRWKCICSQKDA
jgi:hypothetical protein